MKENEDHKALTAKVMEGSKVGPEGNESRETGDNMKYIAPGSVMESEEDTGDNREQE